MASGTRSAASTRTRLLDAAELLLSTHGSHGCGLNEVCQVSGVAYGSLYHAFPDGKGALVAAAIQRSGATVGDALEQLLNDLPFPEAARAIFTAAASTLVANGFTRGCPVGTPAASATSAAAQAEASEAFARWSRLVREAARRAGHDEASASRLGQVLVALYEGALLTARTLRSVEPLMAAADSAAALAQAGATPEPS